MTNDALLVLETLFVTIWRLFTSWHIPGTNVTPAVAFVFLTVAGIGLRFISRIFNIPLGAPSVRDLGDLPENNRAASISPLNVSPNYYIGSGDHRLTR